MLNTEPLVRQFCFELIRILHINYMHRNRQMVKRCFCLRLLRK